MKNNSIIIKDFQTNENVSTIKETIPYSVNRKVLSLSELDEISGYCRQINGISIKLKSCFQSITFLSVIYNICPIMQWLPKYKIKDYLVGDLIAGFTIAVLHIPQGMAYGLLAGLDPIAGLYVAFVPTLVYSVFGTSRHASTGTFSIGSIMVAVIVDEYSDPNYGDSDLALEPSYSKYQVATAVTFACALIQLLMYALRLGIAAALLSEALISGFTTAAAIQIVVINLKDILGVNVILGEGVIIPAYETIQQISKTHLTTFYISIGCMIFMILMTETVKPWLFKKLKFPIPAELIAVVGFTVISYFMELESMYGVSVVGKIPQGLPPFEIPSLKLVQLVFMDSIATSIVTYSIVISMAMMFALKDKYEVRANQELLAVGLSNILGSCFSSIPVSCALSRSVVQYQTGGKTQVASIFSVLLILILLLWLGPLFEMLPRAVLAAIITISLKDMLWQFKDIKKYYNESKLDALVWIVTFTAVILIGIDVGLLIGAIVSLFVFYMKGFKSYSCSLGQVSGTDIYVDINNHQNVVEVPKVKIFRFFGPINFVTCSGFKSELYTSIGINLNILRKSARSTQEKIKEYTKGIVFLILDFQAVSHLDIRGYQKLIEIKNELKVMEMKVFLVNVSEIVHDLIVRAVTLGEEEFGIFPTIHDAILYAEKLN